jgi:hypothetical protein
MPTKSTQARATDARFTLSREYCGYARPRWVLRFCGEWIKSYSNKRSAEAGRINAINQRRASL